MRDYTAYRILLNIQKRRSALNYKIAFL